MCSRESFFQNKVGTVEKEPKLINGCSFCRKEPAYGYRPKQNNKHCFYYFCLHCRLKLICLGVKMFNE